MVAIPVAGYLPDGVSLAPVYGVNSTTNQSVSTAGGMLNVALNAVSGVLLVSGTVDLTPPAAPSSRLGPAAPTAPSQIPRSLRR